MSNHPHGASLTPGAALSRADTALALLLLINLLNYLDRQVLAAVVGPIKASFFGDGSVGGGATLAAVMLWFEQRLGFKPEDALVGLLGTAFMVVYMIGAPTFARLAERTSRWVLIGIGAILWSLASGASGLAPTFVALLLTRCLVGVGEAAYGPVAPAMLADLYPVRVRGRVLSWFYMAIPVGSALGYVLGGWVAGSGIGAWGASALGTPPESWRWAFLLVVPPGILLGLLALVRRESRPAHRAAPAVRWGDYLLLLRTPSYVLCTLGMTAMTFAIGGIAFWMPYYLETRPGAPAASTLIFGLITVAAGMSGTLLGGLLGDRLRVRFPGAYLLVSAAAMFAGFPLSLGALEAPFPWIWVLIFLTVFCLFFNTGPTNTVLANVTPPSKRAAAFALSILITHALGDVISPVVIGLLSDRFQDLGTAFVLVALMFLVAGALWLAGAPHLQPDMDALHWSPAAAGG